MRLLVFSGIDKPLKLQPMMKQHILHSDDCPEITDSCVAIADNPSLCNLCDNGATEVKVYLFLLDQGL